MKLNLPIELLKQYRYSKSSKELLAFAIALKVKYRSSTLINVNPYEVMKLMHVSYNKAKLLILEAQNSVLFSTCKVTHQLTSKTFKSTTQKCSKRGNIYYSDYCYKLTMSSDEVSLKNIVKKLNKILIEFAINAVNRDNLYCRNNSRYVKGISQKQLGKVAGLSRCSAYRCVKELIKKEGVIESQRCDIHLAISSVNNESIKEWNKKTNNRKFVYNPKDNTAYVIEPNIYTFTSNVEENKFKHIIYTNYSRTHKLYDKEIKLEDRRIINGVDVANYYAINFD